MDVYFYQLLLMFYSLGRVNFFIVLIEIVVHCLERAVSLKSVVYKYFKE